MKLFNLSLIILIMCSFIRCGGDDDPTGPDNTTVPTLTTNTVSAITQNMAESGGNITSDGGAAVTTRGVCWSMSSTPTIADNKTSDGSGTGSFNSSITGLTAVSAYYVRAYATNSAGTGYGSVQSFSTTGSSVTVMDIDGNVYQTVTIGTQVWMAENLKVTHYRNGDPIPNMTNSQWWNLTSGAYCDYVDYMHQSDNVETYGRLYNWYAVSDSRNIAPTGWHVPTDEEWKQLEMYLGMSQAEADSVSFRGTDEGGKLKETGTTHWGPSSNIGATNESGFSTLPGGWRNSEGKFIQMGGVATFWSSTEHTEYGSSIAWGRLLTYNSSQVFRLHNAQHNGFSVRCVKD